MHSQRRVICWLTFAIALFGSQVAWAWSPVATNDNYTISVNTTLTIAAPGVLANDRDPDGQSLTAVRVSNPSHGALTLNANGSFTYRPATNYAGSDAFTYKAYDGGNYSGVATVTITVTPAITITTPPANQTVCPGGTATFTVVASGNALRYQWRFGATTLAGATNSTLVLNNVNAASAGIYSVVVSGAAGASKTNSATLTVNAAVNATPLTNLTRFVGSIAIFSTTPSGAGPFSYIWKKNNSVISGQTSNRLTLTNVQVSDSATYSVTVSGACGSVTHSAFLDVDTCFPSVDVVLVLDRSGSMTGKPYNDARLAATNFVRNLHLGGTNLDQAALVSYNSSTTLDRMLTNSLPSLEQGIAGIPAAGGYTCISCGIQTGQNELASARHKSNALPVLVLLSDGLPTQGDTPSAALAAATQAKNAGTRIFTVGLGDVDHALMGGIASTTNDYYYATNSSQLAALFDAISTVICRPPTNIFGPSNTVVCSGAAVTLRVDASGCDAFAYQWRKDGATLAGQTNNALVLGAVTPAHAGVYSVVVTSACRNQTNNATLTVNAPATIVTPPANRIGFIGSNTLFSVSATGTGLSYQWRFNGSLIGTNSTLAINNLGTNHAGTYCVRVASSVCGGAVTNCATLTIQNRAPVAGSDSYSTAEDTALNISAPGVLANDSDPDGNPLTSVLVSNPAHGTLTLNANGSFTYQPALNYNGPDSFTYRASDGDLTSAITPVNISVTPRNDPPVANNDAYTIAEDAVLTIAAPGVLMNDTDPDGDTLTPVLVGAPTHGTVTVNADGAFTYRPATNYNGSDTFTYRASDRIATSGVATVSITVTPINDAPVARDDSYSTPEDTALVIVAPGVLANDSDVDGNGLRSLLVSGTTHGVVTLSTNGSFIYRPNDGYNGLDHFTYRANDGSLNSGVATVRITVTPVNDPPMVTIISPTNGSTYIAPANFSVIADANDSDGVVTNVQIFSGANLIGSLTDAPYFVPQTNLPPGIYSYYATATDNGGLRATSSVVIVTITSSPPVTALGPIALNRQNGLFEQFVRVSNPTPQDFPNGMRVFAELISDNPSNRVWNATGTNASGVAFVDSPTPLPSGGSNDVLIQYYLPEPRSVPTVILTAEPLPFVPPAIPQPKVMKVSRSGSGAVIEFTTVKNHVYYLQCSDDLVRWTTIPGLLHGTGSRVQGRDPGSAPSRFYKVIVIH